jgi:hypothetical protein
MKTPIFEIQRRIRRLARPHRIAFLRNVAALEPERSIRREEILALLRDEMRKQLRSETRAA